MSIRDRHTLSRSAAETLARDGAQLQQMLLLYLGIITFLSLCASILTVLLSEQIAGTGGLHNMGLRSILSTAQMLLPLVQTIAMMGLQMGYYTAALHAQRNKSFSRDTLFGGFRRFFPLLWSYVLQGFVYVSLGIMCMYLGSYIFLFLPMSENFQAIMMPLMESISVMSDTIVLDEATVASVTEALKPALWIIGALYLPILIPTFYRYRMTVYRLIDQPQPRSLAALRESRLMMHRNRLALLKVDLSLWWFYALQVVIVLVCYGDLLLALLGVTLPWSGTVSYFLFLILSLILQFVLFYFSMNRVTLTYISAYEALLPEFENRIHMMQQKRNVVMQTKKPWKEEY